MDLDLMMITKKSKRIYTMPILAIEGDGFIVAHLKEWLLRKRRYQKMRM